MQGFLIRSLWGSEGPVSCVAYLTTAVATYWGLSVNVA
ncbi:hypothetical protein EV139_1303 [Leucobacter luti]|uniref:Uncharacterized protein n=1 Tax=Leucobacter luti TaxID=340320 RepID=A0A4Q7TXB7_9MICO|nr:hypothetical protein EV139_1303 [Leucobacter luti]